MAALAISSLLAGCGTARDNASEDPDRPFPDYTATFLQGPPNQAYMEAAPLSKDGHRFWMLPATPQTTQWGVYDNTVAPVLRIDPGDTVAIETEPAGGGQVAPGVGYEGACWYPGGCVPGACWCWRVIARRKIASSRVGSHTGSWPTITLTRPIDVSVGCT